MPGQATIRMAVDPDGSRLQKHPMISLRLTRWAAAEVMDVGRTCELTDIVQRIRMELFSWLQLERRCRLAPARRLTDQERGRSVEGLQTRHGSRLSAMALAALA